MTTQPESFPLVEQLEALLLEAAERRAQDVRHAADRGPAHRGTPSKPRRDRPRRWRPAALVAVGAVLIAGTALAATQPWAPVLGGQDRGHPTVSPGAPPDDQTSVLAVLRRPQTDQDRSSAVQRDLRLIGQQEHGVQTRYIRYLAPGLDGSAIVLVPSERFADEAAGSGSPTVDAPLCVFYPIAAASSGPPAGGAFPCWTGRDIRAGRATAEAAPTTDHLHLFGLVPDGVKTVVAHFSDGSTATASTSSNFFDVPLGDNQQSSPATIQWRAADGSPVGPPSGG